MTEKNNFKRRGRADWTAAAIKALAEGGLAAVAVEPLAVKLGATKGSFYWHFPNREALLDATLRRWENDYTESVIDLVEAESDPANRLRKLFESVLNATHGPHVELALLSSADDPLVAATVRRVTERRIAYLASLFGRLGFSRQHARHRAMIAYSVYLGQAQLIRSVPGTIPAAKSAKRLYLDDMLRILTTSVRSPT